MPCSLLHPSTRIGIGRRLYHTHRWAVVGPRLSAPRQAASAGLLLGPRLLGIWHCLLTLRGACRLGQSSPALLAARDALHEVARQMVRSLEARQRLTARRF